MRIRKKYIGMLLCAVLLFSGAMLMREYHADRQSAESFAALRETTRNTSAAAIAPSPTVATAFEQTVAAQTAVTAASTTTAAAVSTSAATAASTTAAAPSLSRDIAALASQNSDCIGWIAVRDTEIDYPLVHTPDDPERYLRRDFWGSYSRAGVPFLDARCTLSSDCLFVYGHNLNNGTMFSTLMHYTDLTYAAAHPEIELETARGVQNYTVIAVAAVNADDLWYQITDYRDETHFEGMLAYLNTIAVWRNEVIPQYGEQLLTLSTCDNVTDAGRVIIVAAQKN